MDINRYLYMNTRKFVRKSKVDIHVDIGRRTKVDIYPWGRGHGAKPRLVDIPIRN